MFVVPTRLPRPSATHKEITPRVLWGFQRHQSNQIVLRWLIQGRLDEHDNLSIHLSIDSSQLLSKLLNIDRFEEYCQRQFNRRRRRKVRSGFAAGQGFSLFRGVRHRAMWLVSRPSGRFFSSTRSRRSLDIGQCSGGSAGTGFVVDLETKSALRTEALSLAVRLGSCSRDAAEIEGAC